MKDVRIIEIKESVFADNNHQAELLREDLKDKGVFLLNLMSSPGSGKTTLLNTIGGLDKIKSGKINDDYFMICSTVSTILYLYIY